MNQFHNLFRWAWSVFVVCALAASMGGCDGKDGATGPAGPPGATGSAGPPGPGLDPVEAAIAAAGIESCSTCHSGAGDMHQAVYDEYVTAGTLEMTIDGVTSIANVAGGFDLTVNFSLTKNGLPYDQDPANFEGKNFWFANQDAAGEFVTADPTQHYNAFFFGYSLTNPGGGNYVFSINVPYDVNAFAGGAFFAALGMGPIDFPDQTNAPPNGRVRGYKELATAAYPLGGGSLAGWQSAANVEGCRACHGTPYRKHGNIEAEVAGVPDFANCKSCHLSDQAGGHPDWQYMVDDPYNWATDVPATADYSYTRNLMNDVHMSHAMEFPYPQSMANCVTCHDGNIASVTDNSRFTPETCKSCHPVDGIGAWPDAVGSTEAGPYDQPHRAPPLKFLWARANVVTVHTFADINAVDCAGQCHGGNFSSFNDYHTGYDTTIYTDTGERYADEVILTIDDAFTYDAVAKTITFNFSATSNIAGVDAANMVPDLYLAGYGYNTKDPLASAYTSHSWQNYYAAPGEAFDLIQGAGATWSATYDLTRLEQDPSYLEGAIRRIEFGVAAMLSVNGENVVIKSQSRTFNLETGVYEDYYADIVNYDDKCSDCHDQLQPHLGYNLPAASNVRVCRQCHAPSGGSGHLEMQSRSFDSYIHSIHSFQGMDTGSIDFTDPVEEKRYGLHIEHTFPNFTTLSCEACHVEGVLGSVYNVPDQSKSLGGVISGSATWSVDRNIGSVPSYVVGPASRACGGCHRAEFINEDAAGQLAAWNAHTETFGYLVENDVGVFEALVAKFMALFE